MTKFGQSITEYAYDLSDHEFAKLMSQMVMEAKSLIAQHADSLSEKSKIALERCFGPVLDAVIARLFTRCNLSYAMRKNKFSAAADELLRREFCEILCSTEMSDARSEICHYAKDQIETLRCSAFFNQIPNGNILALAADRIFRPDEPDFDDLAMMVYVTSRVRGHEETCSWSPELSSCVVVPYAEIETAASRYSLCYA